MSCFRTLCPLCSLWLFLGFGFAVAWVNIEPLYESGMTGDNGRLLDPGTLSTGRTTRMITVGMNYHVIEGKQQDFEEKFAGVIDALNSADGHTSSTLWKDTVDGASYLITSEWSDEDAFTAFIRSDDFRAVTNWGKEQILSGRPQHKIYKT